MIDGSAATSFPYSSPGTLTLEASGSSPIVGPLVILKLGGSVLSLPDLATRIASIAAQRSTVAVAMVVGGGAAADVVRAWDRVLSLGDEAAHRLALSAMRLSAEFVAQRLSSARIVETNAALADAMAAGNLPLLAADAWLNRAEAAGRDTVPHSWDATSDSIAAWLAVELAAAELVLLKSVDCPHCGLPQAADEGLVDACFPGAAARVPRLSWVNLRSADCRIEPWTCDTTDRHGERRS